MIENLAFSELFFNKIYTYSFEVRPQLYPVIKELGYQEEVRIKNATQQDNKLVDALVHSKRRDKFRARQANASDIRFFYDLSNDPLARSNSLNPKTIIWEDHVKWFSKRLINSNTQLYLFEIEDEVGFVRLENKDMKKFISFVVAPAYRGKGLGYRFIEHICLMHMDQDLAADVLETNQASHKIFLVNKFKLSIKYSHNSKSVYRYVRSAL